MSLQLSTFSIMSIMAWHNWLTTLANLSSKEVFLDISRFIISFCQLITKLFRLILSIAIAFSLSIRSLRLSHNLCLYITDILRVFTFSLSLYHSQLNTRIKTASALCLSIQLNPNYYKLMIIIALLFTLLTASSQNRVIEITTSNVQLLLKTIDKLHLLLHSPSCPHSKQYANKFLQVKTPYNLGITDCEREKILCNHLNITHFPTLVQLTSTAMGFVDEQQFLVREGLIGESDPKAVLNAIVRRLKEESKHVTVVLQEEGLPVIERLSQTSEKGIYYLEPASRLYKHISSMVGKKIGCWILSTKNNKLQKYYCGNGYKAQQLSKYLQNYEKEKLVSHVFSRQVNASFIQQSQLQQIIKDGLVGSQCKLVYFYSKECEHCSMSDVKRLEYVLEEMRVKGKYGLQVFDLDHEEVPKGLNIKRTPELMEFCGSQRREFGGIFDIKSLQKFITNSIPNPKKPQTAKSTQL